MLKLKYLSDNRDLAITLLSNWTYDSENIGIMDYYRISSNAIYPFYRDGNIYFLRFTPFEEKPLRTIQAELEFLAYLRVNKYPAPKTVLSKANQEIAVCETPWGKYTAVVFESAGGYDSRLDRLDYSDGLYYGYGEMLGRLHLLSKEYKPEVRRPGWREILHRTAEILKEHNAPEKALKEVSILEDFFGKLPITLDTYGLVHYDFEPDNIFYNSGTYSVIDFDDAMYHWYVMDIEQSIDGIREELPEQVREQAVGQFLNGYRSVLNIDESIFSLIPVFKRYADLYGYARCLRAVHEKPDNEPDWLIELRTDIVNIMDNRSKNFGKDIN